MLDLLKSAVKGGFRTSEFWLAVLALLLPLADGAVQKIVDAITSAGSTVHNPVYLAILTGAAAFVSAAYSVGRSLVKREQVRQIPTAAALDGYTNVRTAIPDGSAADEAAHAIRAGAPPTIGSA